MWPKDLPSPVIRSHYGNGFVKQYVRDHLMLRTEAASNNVNDYGVNKSIENLPVLRNALATEREMAELLRQKEMLLHEMRHRVAKSLQIIASILLLKVRFSSFTSAAICLST